MNCPDCGSIEFVTVVGEAALSAFPSGKRCARFFTFPHNRSKWKVLGRNRQSNWANVETQWGDVIVLPNHAADTIVDILNAANLV